MSRINATRKALLTAISNPAWVCFVWFGMTAGISLLESPARFTVPGLPRALALDVGRVVFSVLNKAELAALIVLLVLVRISGRARDYWAGSALLTLIIIAQSAWLLPELSARSLEIAAGGQPAPSLAHGTYATLEILKLLTLLYLGFRAMSDSREKDGL
jgi:hypothetical protein